MLKGSKFAERNERHLRYLKGVTTKDSIERKRLLGKKGIAC